MIRRPPRSTPFPYTPLFRSKRREEEIVILKKGASAFFGTTLPSILVSQGVDTIVLCGATTSGCIRATAVDLMQYGYPTLVPRECVGDRDRKSTRLNSSHANISYAVFCLKKKNHIPTA